MANLQHIENHLDLAKDNLLTQDRGKPVLDGLLTAILTPLQEIESKLFELYKQRSIDQATGYYLDGIGETKPVPTIHKNSKLSIFAIANSNFFLFISAISPISATLYVYIAVGKIGR